MSALKQILSKKTDKELLFYINNIDKHTEEAVQLALAELKQRNVELPETVTSDIAGKLNVRTIQTLQGKEEVWTENIDEYFGAPECYTKTAVYTFSILFSVLLGAYMLAVNCKATGRRMWPVALFGVFYTVSLPFVLSFMKLDGIGFGYIANSVVTLVMYELFWNSELERDFKCRAKPILIPLIIGIIIAICIFIRIVILKNK